MMFWRTFGESNLLPTTWSIRAPTSRSAQPVDSEGGHVRPSNPWRVELGPKRHNQQHPEGWYLVDDATEQFEAGGVGPLCILENNQQWVLAR